MKTIPVAALALAPLVAKDDDPAKRLDAAAVVFSEVMSMPDQGIPQDPLANAHCIVIVPGLKTATFFFGANNATPYGRKLENRDIATTSVRPSRAADHPLNLLDRYSPVRDEKSMGSGQ